MAEAKWWGWGAVDRRRPVGPRAREMLTELLGAAEPSAPVALEEVRRCAGSQFDPRVVDAFCAAIGERAADTALG